MYHMLDQKSLTSYFNGIDDSDIVCGDQPGLTTQMKQLQSFQNRFVKKIVKLKMSSDVVAVGVFTCEAVRSSLLCCAGCNER